MDFTTGKILIQVPSSLSLVCDIFIILSFVVFGKIRRFRYLQFVCFVAMGNFFTSLALSLGFHANGSSMCSYQSHAIVFGVLSTMIWTMMISYQVYITIKFRKILKNTFLLHLFCWGVPAFFAFGPDITQTPYGYDDEFWEHKHGFCFFRYQTSAEAGWFLSFIILSVSIYSIMFYYFIRVYKLVQRLGNTPTASAISSVFTALRFYSPVLLILYIPILIVMFLFLCYHEGIKGIYASVGIFFVGWIGVCNAFLLLSRSPVFFHEWEKTVQKLYRFCLCQPQLSYDSDSTSSGSESKKLQKHFDDSSSLIQSFQEDESKSENEIPLPPRSASFFMFESSFHEDIPSNF